MIYFQLFLSFLQIGAFSFGGGYAAMPLIQNQVVTLHGWLNLAEFTDLVTISQMTPGPIAINAATFVGTRIAGTPGDHWVRAAVLHPGYPSCKDLSQIQEFKPDPGCPQIPAACRGSHDWCSGRQHTGHCLLGTGGLYP